MRYCSECGHRLDEGTEKYCPECGYKVNEGGEGKAVVGQGSAKKNSVNIENTGGDVFGVGVSGSGNIIGKNIVVGSGTINASQQELSKIPEPVYANALKRFSESINQQLEGKQIPEEQVKEINNNLNELAREVQNIKTGEEKQISSAKRRTLNGKFGNVVRGVLKVLPTAARIGSSLFAPLAPFSDAMGESVQNVVADYIE